MGVPRRQLGRLVKIKCSGYEGHQGLRNHLASHSSFVKEDGEAQRMKWLLTGYTAN